MTTNPPTHVSAWAYLIVAFLLVQIIGSLGDRRAATERIARLEHHSRDLTREVSDLRARVLRLERPDEPVHPPRHPGRIGGKPVTPKPAFPWVQPWPGEAPSIGTEIGTTGDQPIGTIDRK